ncbi:MAG: NUDIX hydrolase [Bacteroidales bacterium]
MERKMNPNISVDVVIFAVDEKVLRVLLVDRQMGAEMEGVSHPMDSKLPGGLVFNDELLIEASQRILSDHTGVEGIDLEQFGVLDSLERMNNEWDKKWLEKTSGVKIDRVVSIAFYGIAHYEQVKKINLKNNAHWTILNDKLKLPFDHNEIINAALEKVKTGLKKDALLFQLLPEKFTISQLKNILEVFYEKDLDSRNFRKKIKKLNYIVALEEKQSNVPHKPAGFFRFDKKRFMQFNNDRITF